MPIAPSLMGPKWKAYSKLISNLQENELKRAELLLELTNKHPKIRSLNNKIEKIQNKIHLNIRNLKKYLIQKKKDLGKM